MIDRALIGLLTDAQVVGLTLYGEARNQGPEGRIAVANVIRNRVRAQRSVFGWDARAVCLKPSQFSCWREAGGAANYALVLDMAEYLHAGKAPGPVLKECLWIADGLLVDAFVDSTHGATHYLTADLLATAPPSWAAGQKPLATIGAHVFLRVA